MLKSRCLRKERRHCQSSGYIIFALKGVAAYATHAKELGYVDDEVNKITQEALYSTLTNVNFNLQETIEMALKVGSATVKIMDVLDQAHTKKFGIPQPITVSQNKIEGHCIVVTGHNLSPWKNY